MSSNHELTLKLAEHMLHTPAKHENTNCCKKKPTSAQKLSPGTLNDYSYVKSPVALYIKCSPRTPVIRNVVPKKGMPKLSSVPELTGNRIENMVGNTESVELSPCIYRGAKETKIAMADTPKIPQASWSNMIILSAPSVRRHVSNREITETPVFMEGQDSVCDISDIPQADLSLQVEGPGLAHFKL